MAEKKEKSTGKIQAQIDEMFKRIGALSRIQRLLICVGTLLVIGGGYYYFSLSPRLETLKIAKQTLEQKKSQLANYKAKARVLKKYEKRMDEAREQFNIAMTALPDKKEVPALLDSISEAGTLAGLEFRLFEPGSVVEKDFYKEIPISMDVSGSYHQIADFFFQMANLNRIVNVASIDMKHDGKTKDKIQMKCSAITYMFTEPKSADSGNKSKKKNKQG